MILAQQFQSRANAERTIEIDRLPWPWTLPPPDNTSITLANHPLTPRRPSQLRKPRQRAPSRDAPPDPTWLARARAGLMTPWAAQQPLSRKDIPIAPASPPAECTTLSRGLRRIGLWPGRRADIRHSDLTRHTAAQSQARGGLSLPTAACAKTLSSRNRCRRLVDARPPTSGRLH